MTEKYTPEKVAELAERLRSIAESQWMDFDSPHVGMTLDESAVALTAVSADVEMWKQETDDAKAYAVLVEAERDAEHGRAERLEENRSSWIGDAMELVAKAEAKADRLHKAITEALDHDPLHGRSEGWHCVGMSYCIHGILRAALDKEGNDDE